MLLSSFLLTVPPVLLLIYGLARCSFFGRPGAKLWLAAALGCLVTVPCYVINSFFRIGVFPDSEIERTGLFLINSFIREFIITGPNEEFLKLIALIVTIYVFGLQKSPMTIVASGLAVGLGFAGIENYWMVETERSSALNRTHMIFVHPMLTGCAAILLSIGILREGVRWRYWASALIIPSSAHGSINFAVAINEFTPIYFDFIVRAVPLIFLNCLFFATLVHLKRCCNLAFFSAFDWRGPACAGFGLYLVARSIELLVFALVADYDLLRDLFGLTMSVLQLDTSLFGLKVGGDPAFLLWYFIPGTIVLMLTVILSFLLLKHGMRRVLGAMREPEDNAIAGIV